MSMTTDTTNELIVETPRGPSIAGTRITVYSVMDFIKDNWSRDSILQVMTITAEQLDAVYEYVERHKAEVEQEYERILRRETEARAEAEKIRRERSPFPPELPWAEKRRLMRQKIAAMKAMQTTNGNQDTA